MRLRSSSTTMESRDGCTVAGPPWDFSPTWAILMPFIPVSVAPIESTTRMFGNSFISWSLIDWEKIAALDPIEISEERSRSSCISSSLSARDGPSRRR